MSQSSKPASTCGQSPRIGLTNDERQALVNRHNIYRRKVAAGQETRGNPGPQPAARSIPDLVRRNILLQ